jgi:hypothetical protein
MNSFNKAVVYFLILCMGIILKGQTVGIDAEFRPRLELRQGFKKPLLDTLGSSLVTLQRTRLNADYKSNSLNAKISLQDSRIWGQGDLKSATPQVSIFEAWFEILLASGFSLEAGRQVLQYDDQRLFGAGNWSNTGNSHDALVLKYKDSDLQINVAAAYNTTTDALSSYKYNVSGMYQSLGLLWLSQKITSDITLTAIGVGEALPRNMVTSGAYKIKTARDSSSTITYGRFTYGANLVYQNDQSVFNGSITAYGQTGRDNKMGDISAYFAGARGSLKLNDDILLSAGFEFYSGTSNEDTIKIGPRKSYTFNKLYGTNHKFNGSMEYWATLPSGGLIDYFIESSYIAGSELSFNLSVHQFFLSKQMYSGKVLLTQKNLGNEADLTISYQWSKQINLQLGYSIYFKTTTTTQINSITSSVKSPMWGFLMLTIKPSLYKSSI